MQMKSCVRRVQVASVTFKVTSFCVTWANVAFIFFGVMGGANSASVSTERSVRPWRYTYSARRRGCPRRQPGNPCGSGRGTCRNGSLAYRRDCARTTYSGCTTLVRGSAPAQSCACSWKDRFASLTVGEREGAVGGRSDAAVRQTLRHRRRAVRRLDETCFGGMPSMPTVRATFAAQNTATRHPSRPLALLAST